MTTDQSHSGFPASFVGNFAAADRAEISENAGIHCQSRIEQLLQSAHEDISRLNEILRTQRCTAILCGTDGVTGRVRPPSVAPMLSSPIFDAEGRALTSLDIISADVPSSACSVPLLRALAEPAARAITERWFRLVHRGHFVVAATPRNAPRASILFATDRDQRIVGADRQARRLLQQRGKQMGPHLAVSALFRASPALLRRRSYGDIAAALFASDGGEPWVALITPPDPGVMESYPDARVFLHVRPRLDALGHLSCLPSTGPGTRGLSQRALQRIAEHVEAHLDAALDIEELAALVRMSSSHFIRSFQRSVGLTPHRYVIQNRVMRARELLSSTDLPLTEIALTTGFSDQSHFSRRFHEVVGIPPGAFRGTMEGERRNAHFI